MSSRQTWSSRNNNKTIKKNGKKPKNKRGPGRGPGLRSHADRVWGQGVGAITNSPFGNRSNRVARNPRFSLDVWDAKLPMHLPLPRPVGPYLTLRLTKAFGSSDEVHIFGTYKDYQSPTGITHWSDICCISTGPAGSLGPISSARSHKFPSMGLNTNVTWVPSAITVQAMNPNAVGTSKGIMFAGVSQTQLPLGNEVATWESVADSFISYQKPRVLSAGKLALRGVQISSYPLNMSELANFTTMAAPEAEGDFNWTKEVTPVGFAPIVFVNAGTTDSEGVITRETIEFVVTTEYRVRFDFNHPASAAHVQHPIASDATWNSLMQKAVSLGHGVMDIADVVADLGQAARTIMPKFV